jgi:hypothetical protein
VACTAGVGYRILRPHFRRDRSGSQSYDDDNENNVRADDTVRYNDVEDIDSDFDTYYEPVVEKVA